MSALILSPPVGSIAIQAVAHTSLRSNTDRANIKIMTAAIVVLLSVVLFIICLHLYAKWLWRNAHLIQRRLDIDYEIDEPFGQQFSGLEKDVVDSLPTFTYARESMAKATECAVCLCEFEEKDVGRLLPKCSHMFHTECIDMWFKSHSTCPLCRLSLVVTSSAEIDSEEGPATIDSHRELLPTQPSSMSFRIDFNSLDNVLLLGYGGAPQPLISEDSSHATGLQQMQESGSVSYPEGSQPYPMVEAKSLSKQLSQLASLSLSQREGPMRAFSHLAIEVPRRCADCASASCSCCGRTSCVKSPLSRFSLRRLLSRDRKVAPSSSSGEFEEGVHLSSTQLPRIPL